MWGLAAADSPPCTDRCGLVCGWAISVRSGVRSWLKPMLRLDWELGTFGGRSLVGRRSVRVWAVWLALLVGRFVVLWLACRLGLVAGWSVGRPAGRSAAVSDEKEEARPGCDLLEVGWLVLVGLGWLVLVLLVGSVGRSVGSVGRLLAGFGRLVGCLAVVCCLVRRLACWFVP